MFLYLAKNQQRGKPQVRRFFQADAFHANTLVAMDPDRSASHVDDSGPPTLSDQWGRPLYLNGPLERTSRQSPAISFIIGILGLGVAFILSQLIAGVIVISSQIGQLDPSSLESRLSATPPREFIIANSIAQLLGLAVPALVMSRLHTRQVTDYVRLRSIDFRLVLLALVGVIGLQPVVQWLAQLNKELPLPEAIRAFEQTQLELIQSVLESGLGVGFNLTMLALTPGICEELLFRGYAQRQFERSTGIVGGILLSGILFGLYHFRPSQLLPLAVLGIYLAYLTWRTGSLWPAIVVHTAHNGFAVLVSRYAQQHPSYDLEAMEQATMPWYAVVGGFAIFGAVLYVLHPLARRLRDNSSAGFRHDDAS